MDYRELQQKLAQKDSPCRIRCCTVGSCLSANGLAIKTALAETVEAKGLSDRIDVKGVGCLGLCSKGPLVQIDPGGVLYDQFTLDQAFILVNELAANPTFLGNEPSHSIAADSCSSAPLRRSDYQPETHPFFTRQKRIVLENSGLVNPESIKDYVAVGGYKALHTALRELSRHDIIRTIKESGLRGRGGAGYPTGLKWDTVAKMPANQKYVVCNADEGDPGAYMDRSVLEGDPHRVLEGMAITAYAVGANQGYIYVRGEYPLAIRAVVK